MANFNLINSYVIPRWFTGFDIVMELLFAIVCIAVAVFAYKIYKISKEKNIRLFSIGFLLIAVSYIVHALINIYITSEIVSEGPREIIIEHLQLAALLGLILYMSIFIVGLITIFYSNHRCNKNSSFYLLLVLGLLAVLTDFNYIASFHITSTVILLFINFHYATDYIKYKNHKTLYVFIAFIFLLLSHAVFILPVSLPEYVIAHFLELVAYSLILFSLIKNLKIKPTRKIP